jgi:hypothetical protein
MHKQNAALLARMAELSSLINGTANRKRQKTTNKVYVRPVAVAAAEPVLAPVAPPPPPAPPVAAARYDKKKRRFVNPVWKPAVVADAPSAPSPRPAPVSRKRLKERLKPSKRGNRVAMFREEGAFRKLRPNVLARSESLGNKTLRVPKPKQRPVCSFFLRGECFKEDCEFSHVNVGLDAPLCDDFARGFCELGEQCPKRHVKKKSKSVMSKHERDEDADNEEFIKL